MSTHSSEHWLKAAVANWKLPMGEFQAFLHPIVFLPPLPFYTHPTVLSSGPQNSVVSKQDISYCFFLLFTMGTG